MRHRWIGILLVLLILQRGAAAVPKESMDNRQFPQFEFIHYSSGGTAERYPAIILFEESNSTFTAYQVAFLSCTCRDSLVNYYSVCYVELLNTKPSSEQAAIRTIQFGDNMGVYGDSNPNYYIRHYTQSYMDENFIQRLVRATKADFDAWGGYGTQLAQIDVEAVSGATVTTGNITSLLKSLFEYHAVNYYGDVDDRW